jgi:hypothetical protein
MKKICNSCNDPKSLIEFNKQKGSPDGLGYKCKSCVKKYNKKYYQKYQSEIIEHKKRYQKENIDQYRESQRKSYIKNKDKHNERSKKYHQKYKPRKNKKRSDKYKTDPLYKVECIMRARIHNALKDKNHDKKNKTTSILGCTYDELKKHIESLFEPWMNWDNHGLYNGEYNHGWDIDHIIPMSSAISEEEILKLSHYTNLKPLCSKINRFEKRDIIPNHL